MPLKQKSLIRKMIGEKEEKAEKLVLKRDTSVDRGTPVLSILLWTKKIGARTCSITTLSITTLSIIGLFATLSIHDTLHK
jgi:hypothetical protein